MKPRSLYIILPTPTPVTKQQTWEHVLVSPVNTAVQRKKWEFSWALVVCTIISALAMLRWGGAGVQALRWDARRERERERERETDLGY